MHGLPALVWPRWPRIGLSLTLLLAAASILAIAAPAGAAQLLVGDLVVVDPDARRVARYELGLGVADAISSNGLLLYPSGVAAAGPDALYVADPDLAAIVHVDPSNGAQSIVCSGPPLLYPTGVAVDAYGLLLVADPVANRVFRIDPGDCTAQVWLEGPPLLFPSGVRVDANGDVLVADPDANAVFRYVGGIVPALLSEADLLRSPQGVAEDGGDQLVVEPVAGRIVRVSAGVQTLEEDVVDLPFPSDLEVVPVPEPGVALGMGCGVLLLGVLARRRHARSTRFRGVTVVRRHVRLRPPATIEPSAGRPVGRGAAKARARPRRASGAAANPA